MYTCVKTITPLEAQEILATKNFNNRPIKPRTVKKYAQEMRRGRWKLSGEPIIFGKSGRLLNGQHRLMACVEADTPFQTVVVFGAEDEAFDVIDDNTPRSIADDLAIKGHINTKTLGAGIRFVWNYTTGNVRSRGRNESVIPTRQLVEKLFERHKGIVESVKLYHLLVRRAGGILLPPSLVVGLHYLCGLVDQAKADEFFTSFQSGLNLDVGHPVAILRSKIIGEGNKYGSARKLLFEAEYTYTVKAWNAFMAGKKIKPQLLSYDPEKPMPEIDNLPRETMKDLL